jgi:hypothetical protein
MASTLFCKQIGLFFDSSPAARVEVAWVKGHAGIQGNERADEQARAAVTLKPVTDSTITYAKERATRYAIRSWTRDWRLARPARASSLSAAITSRPPSTTLNPFFKEFDGKRLITSRLVQAAIGHGFFGQYYSRFVPTEATSCPCGSPSQTRHHIIAECPLSTPGRQYLRNHHFPISCRRLFESTKGLWALSKFLVASNAFGKSTPDAHPVPLPNEPLDHG